MNCHYSCSSCSAPIYLYNCLTCPVTRVLLGSTCVCQDGLLEAQSTSCLTQLPSTIIQNSQTNLNQFFLVLYYINIGLFWLYVVLTMCRINLPKIRLIVMFGQLLSLINYYPFYQYETAQKALYTFQAFNYNYLVQLYTCTQTGLPTICTDFENIIPPLILIPIFLSGYLASYVILNICYSTSLVLPISFFAFIKKSWFLMIFHYTDITAILWSISIARVILSSAWGFLIMGGYLIFLGFAIIMFYKFLNDKSQITHLYRVQNNWAYLYDQNYHLAYIDYVFQFEAKIQQEKEEAQFLRQQPNLIKAFVPGSNFIILEILFKILIGASSVFLFNYKPALFAIPIGILFIIGILYFGTFQGYQNWDLVAYITVIVFYQASLILFWTDFYWGIASALAIIASLSIVVNFGVLIAIKVRMDEVEINFMFKQQRKKDRLLMDDTQQKGSDNQLMNKDSQNEPSVEDEHEQTNENLNILSEQKKTNKNISRMSFVRNPQQSGLISNNLAGQRNISSSSSSLSEHFASRNLSSQGQVPPSRQITSRQQAPLSRQVSSRQQVQVSNRQQTPISRQISNREQTPINSSLDHRSLGTKYSRKSNLQDGKLKPQNSKKNLQLIEQQEISDVLKPQ